MTRIWIEFITGTVIPFKIQNSIQVWNDKITFEGYTYLKSDIRKFIVESGKFTTNSTHN